MVGVPQGHQRHNHSIDRAHTIFYSNFVETVRLSCTVFEILSLIVENLKRLRDSDHATFGTICRP